MQYFKNLFLVTVVFALSMAMAGCSQNSPGVISPPTTGGGGGGQGGEGPVMSLNGVEFAFVGEASIQSDGSSIAGSGSLIFRDALTEEDNNYALRVALEPGGSVDVIANAKPGLSKGAGMRFTRDADDELMFEVNTSDRYIDVTEDYEDFLGAVEASGEIFIELDVHGHGHVVLWVNEGDEYQAATRRVNGTVWGLVLNKATITLAKSGEPKDKH